MRCRPVVMIAMITVLSMWLPKTAEARIEAVKGKKYRLSKQHGPWMIMVASLAEPPNYRKHAGISYLEAADRLVYELRRKGLPAYVYSQPNNVNGVNTVDRAGRMQFRNDLSRGGVCVLAGNYKNVNLRLAQKTLASIKNFRPRSWENYAGYMTTPGQQNKLLGGAFLTTNPLLSQDEINQQKRDPLLLKLNSGIENSIIGNKGKYTLVIASFYGHSKTQAPGRSLFGTEHKFKIGSSLDDALVQSWQLSKLLRSGGFQVSPDFGVYGFTQPFRPQNFESFVFHDRYRSIVTVGSFNTHTDPRIARLKKLFGAKQRTSANTGQTILAAEYLNVPGKRPGYAPIFSVYFDAKPELIEVPKLR